MKSRRFAWVALALAASASLAAAETPELYRKVASVHSVVRDLGATKAAWSRLGFRSVQDLGEMTVAGSSAASRGPRSCGPRRRNSPASTSSGCSRSRARTRSPSSWRGRRGRLQRRLHAPARTRSRPRCRRSRRSRGCPPEGAGALGRRPADDRPHGHGVAGKVRTRAGARRAAVAARTRQPRPPRDHRSRSSSRNTRWSSRACSRCRAARARLGFPAMDVTHPPLSDLRSTASLASSTRSWAGTATGP